MARKQRCFAYNISIKGLIQSQCDKNSPNIIRNFRKTIQQFNKISNYTNAVYFTTSHQTRLFFTPTNQ
jgi:neutral trehalase